MQLVIIILFQHNPKWAYAASQAAIHRRTKTRKSDVIDPNLLLPQITVNQWLSLVYICRLNQLVLSIYKQVRFNYRLGSWLKNVDWLMDHQIWCARLEKVRGVELLRLCFSDLAWDELDFKPDAVWASWWREWTGREFSVLLLFCLVGLWMGPGRERLRLQILIIISVLSSSGSLNWLHLS